MPALVCRITATVGPTAGCNLNWQYNTEDTFGYGSVIVQKANSAWQNAGQNIALISPDLPT